MIGACDLCGLLRYTVQYAKYLLVYTSMINVGRLLAADREAWQNYDGLRRLGANDDALEAALEPVKRALRAQLRAKKKK